jgi:hypothetical protein
MYVGSQGATLANAVNFTAIRSGRIKSVRWNLLFTSITAASWLAAELSLFPSSQFTSNGANNLIDIHTVNSNFVTSGLAHLNHGKQTMVDVPIGVGEKVYLHLTISGTVAVVSTLLVDVTESGGA